jgi:hypothetical protein
LVTRARIYRIKGKVYSSVIIVLLSMLVSGYELEQKTTVVEDVLEAGLSIHLCRKISRDRYIAYRIVLLCEV